MRFHLALTLVSVSVVCTLAIADEARAPDDSVKEPEFVEVFIPLSARVKRQELCGNYCQLKLDYENEEGCGRLYRREAVADRDAGGRCVLEAVLRYEACLASCPIDYNSESP